jgi:hypothetical protein
MPARHVHIGQLEQSDQGENCNQGGHGGCAWRLPSMPAGQPLCAALPRGGISSALPCGCG